MGNNTTPWAKV